MIAATTTISLPTNNHGYISKIKHIICQNKNPLLKLKMQACASYLSHPYLPSCLAHQSIERGQEGKGNKYFTQYTDVTNIILTQWS